MKKNRIEISVVVPVYNSESTISSCIESILGQTFRRWELILVNDGSRDCSRTICDNYAQGDERVKVIHQPNRGRTEARAAGVKAASGEWVCFVDSDDMLPPESLSCLFAKVGEDTDIVLGNGFEFSGERRDSIPMADFRHLAVRAEGIIGVPWGSLYRRGIVTPDVFDLPRHIFNGEDYVFWLRVVFRTEKPVHVVYENVYLKGDDHTCNSFGWTADYCRELHEYRKASIPSGLHALYMRDMITDRWVNLYAVAVQQPRKDWEDSIFYRDLLSDMKGVGMGLSFKKKVFLGLPSRVLRLGLMRMTARLRMIVGSCRAGMRAFCKGRYVVLSVVLLWLWTQSSAASVTYTPADSLKVMELLKKGSRQPEGANMPLFFAGQLKGVPYVASTLEVNATEELVVNLRQLDCTTLVENVVALTRTVRREHPTFDAFCQELEKIRYSGGVRDGYTSRNHYFSEWIESNERLGAVREVKGKQEGGYAPFVAVQRLHLNYMSMHAGQYPMLKGKPKEIARIAAKEKLTDGKTVRYIPLRLLDKGKDVLGCVRDGDILAIVTKKDGLDTSHLGFAVWQNGKLHLLNASSIHKKVVLESMTLSQYMKKHPSQLGVRVVRVLP